MELRAALKHRRDERDSHAAAYISREINQAGRRIVFVFWQKGVSDRVDRNEQECQAKRLICTRGCNGAKVDRHVEARHVKKRQSDDSQAKQQQDSRVVMAEQISYERHREDDRKSTWHQSEPCLLSR